MNGALLRLLLAVALLAQVAMACAASTIDYEREARWAQEIVPTLVIGDAIHLATPERRNVLGLLTPAAGREKARVILVHGLGVHPDFGVIGALRALLADAGYTTLAVQMPVLAADAPRVDYPVTFGAAAQRLEAAVAYLRERGPGRLVVLAHSVGATMTDAWLARQDAAAIDGWVAIGMPVAFTRAPREPVLDVLAERELPAVVAAAPARKPLLPNDRCSRQTTIAGTDHYFETGEKPLAQVLDRFLGDIAQGRC